mmetsp:Transcript_27385/g.76514  ORF Transcript_27385/g.76514 Transcript_27385/m.76514 type:complete len:417 (+) Transcript_27385:1925-3175(+)
MAPALKLAASLDGFLNGEDGREFLVLHGDRARRTPGGLLSVGHHHSDDLADARHHFAGKALLVLRHRADDVVARHIRGTEVARNAFHGAGSLGIHAQDPGVRLGAHHARCVQHASGGRDVIRVPSFSADLHVSRDVPVRFTHDGALCDGVIVLQALASLPGVGLRGRQLAVRHLALEALHAGHLGRNLDEELEQERGCRSHAEFSHAARGIARHHHVLPEGLEGGSQGLPIPGAALQGGHGLGGENGLGRHAAVGDLDVAHCPAAALLGKSNAHPSVHDRDVVLPPVRLLVLLHKLVFRVEGDVHLLQHLGRLQGRLPVAEEELGGRDFAAPPGRAVRSEHGAAHHVDRVQVGDGARRADVSADGSHILDLGAREPPELLDDRPESGRLVLWQGAAHLLHPVHHVHQGHARPQGEA